jgi:hypothetical protein
MADRGGALPLHVRTLERPVRGRIAPPAVLVESPVRGALAVIDGTGTLSVGRFELSRPSLPELRPVATGADARFAPALAMTARGLLVAWTEAATGSMRVRVATVDSLGEASAPIDVTPAASGGSAPTFEAGATPPVLFFLDARSGVSPLWRVGFDAAGRPRPATVARPLGIAPEPPELAVVRVGSRTVVAYTVIGSAASTAIGIVPLEPRDAEPKPIVRGEAYGQLHVASAPHDDDVALIAVDAGQGAGRDAPREVRVHAVDASGAFSRPLVLRGGAGDGGAAHAAVSRSAVAFTAADGVYVQRIGPCAVTSSVATPSLDPARPPSPSADPPAPNP